TVLAIWGVPTTAFIAVGSTIGVAVGFGAQDVVRDVIAGLLILIEDQYSIGDVVRVADVEGTVEGIKLRTTVLRDLNGNRHFVPNGQIKVASNMTSEFSRLVVDVPVSYETDLDRAIEVIIDEATAMAYSDEWEEHFLEPPTMLGVNRLADSSVEIRVLMTLASESRWLVKREFLKRIKTRLDTERIVIPYNRLRVILDQQDLDR
ncbi:MAG: mechanosensitive ion channel family protein, partial [Acidimicrobiia bacterium]|nr:mechanosensitive ion channel family protein [Acidimicrobiia bacterium]